MQTRTEPVVMEDTKFISKRDLILSVSGALTVGILIALTVYCMMRQNKKKLQHVESGRVSFIRQHHNRKFNLFGKEVKMFTSNRVKCDLFFHLVCEPLRNGITQGALSIFRVSCQQSNMRIIVTNWQRTNVTDLILL